MDEISRDNHFVPQFYFRQFACADDIKKAPVLTHHEPYLVAARALGAVDRPDEAGVIIGDYKLRLRTSTCPPIPVALPPASAGSNPASPDAPRAWWLPLTPHCGALIARGTPFPEFTHVDVEDDVIRVLNRTYLAQLIEGLSVRYCIADDEFLQPDLVWLGYELTHRTAKGFRYQRRSL